MITTPIAAQVRYAGASPFLIGLSTRASGNSTSHRSREDVGPQFAGAGRFVCGAWTGAIVLLTAVSQRSRGLIRRRS